MSALKLFRGQKCLTCSTGLSCQSWKNTFEENAVGQRSSGGFFGKMLLPRWNMWWILLAFCTSARGLEIYEHDNHEVTFSQGLSECMMMNELPLVLPENDGVDVNNLIPKFKLCCSDKAPCVLCLVINTELYIHPAQGMEGELHVTDDEEMRNSMASVTVCFKTAPAMPTCKKVECRIRHADLIQNQAKISMVIAEPAVFPPSSEVFVYPLQSLSLTQKIFVPSSDEVCSQNRMKHTKQCCVPAVNSVINQTLKQVELHFAGRNMKFPSMCIQYEQNGRCQEWQKMTIPLYAVTPCTCLQVWEKDGIFLRSQSCPFRETDFLQGNIWQNVSVLVGQRQMSIEGQMLLWNISAPCRLEGEVWPCQMTASSCREMEGFRQRLDNSEWRQNANGLWEEMRAFENINLQLAPCVMVKVDGGGPLLGPFCYKNTDRWRLSLLVVAVMLLVWTVVIFYCLFHSFVKRWVRSCHHGGFVKIVRKGHVVLLSPPDVDDGVSESVCRLGSGLCSQGFSVSVDQWSRKEQSRLGPLPWLHSQLLKLNSVGGKVVLILTRKALEKTEEFSSESHWHKELPQATGEDAQIWSPYSDVFMASLWCIQADKQMGRTGERFLLVKLDSSAVQRLPELLQGLPLFHLPSQMEALISELTVGGKSKGSGGRTWTMWKWSASDRWTAKTEKRVHYGVS